MYINKLMDVASLGRPTRKVKWKLPLYLVYQQEESCIVQVLHVLRIIFVVTSLSEVLLKIDQIKINKAVYYSVSLPFVLTFISHLR